MKRTAGDTIDKNTTPDKKKSMNFLGGRKKRSASANTRKKNNTRHAMMIRGLTQKEKQIMQGVRKNSSAGEVPRRCKARAIKSV